MSLLCLSQKFKYTVRKNTALESRFLASQQQKDLLASTTATRDTANADQVGV